MPYSLPVGADADAAIASGERSSSRSIPIADRLEGHSAGHDVTLTDACGQTPSFFCEGAWNLTHNRLVARAADWLVMKPVLALVILGITALINKWLRRLVTRLIVRFTNRDQLAVSALSKIGVGKPSSVTVVDPRLARRTSTLTAVSRAVVSTLVWTIGTLLVLGVFGIDLGPLLAGVGIAGIAVGLGRRAW
jgi:small conductance mechanosensitive channel